MTKEEKDLLLKDLCCRLPYKVIVEFVSYKGEEKPWIGELSCKDLDCFIHDVGFVEIKPYLFPLSSMTEEQSNELFTYFHDVEMKEIKASGDYLKAAYLGENAKRDWLDKKHFDYHYLIPKGLAIDASGLNIYD